MQVSDGPLIDARWALPGQIARADSAAYGQPRFRRTPRDWAVDIAFFLFAALLWLASLHINAASTFEVTSQVDNGIGMAAPAIHSSSILLDVVDPVVGALLCLALWWRRRLPVTLAVLAVLAGTFSITSSGAALVIVFTLAVHRPWPISVPLGLLNVPASLVYGRLRPDDSTSFLGSLIFGTLMLLAILAWGIAVRARRQLVLSLRASADQERREHGLLLQDARRAERELIAREMHDVLAHRISLLSVHAGALEYRTRQGEAGTASALTASEVHLAVAVIRENAHQALEELREVLTVLRSEGGVEDAPLAQPGSSPHVGTAAPQPTIGDLATLVAEARAAGQQIHLEIDAPGLEGTRPQLQRTVYRVVQEGLTNARKHAPSALVNVTLRGEVAAGIDLVITNVVPIDAVESDIPGAGAGLAGLAERVAIEGGTLGHEIRGGAFRLRVRLPWRA
ncbi:Histidine kinase [Sanguibacter gelidistatuariae]|uniref:histidine kinase n=1 Tax=Sanguibacter gelidistatuariae TaxID=1814289 RepID=A0A1G6L9W5_9MICO|nr:histidine kinase [Sanguibacter gelidistatuariae]SDC39948.1 Histidine kinase [Sanguibacter gelidistatuariae]